MLQLPNDIELITAASPLMDRESAVLDSHSSKNETFRIGKKFLKESLVEGHFKSRLSRWSRWMQCLGGCQSFPRALEETRVDGFFSLHLSSQRPLPHCIDLSENFKKRFFSSQHRSLRVGI